MAMARERRRGRVVSGDRENVAGGLGRPSLRRERARTTVDRLHVEVMAALSLNQPGERTPAAGGAAGPGLGREVSGDRENVAGGLLNVRKRSKLPAWDLKGRIAEMEQMQQILPRKLAEIEQKYYALEKENQELKAALERKGSIPECPVCLQLMTGKIYTCKNGHAICGTCEPKVTTCATGRTGIGKYIVKSTV